MRLGDWLGLLGSGRFRIDPVKYAMTVLVSGCTAFNSVMAGVQKLALGKRIRETPLVAPPVFIVGHWRSGTTLMHELMSLDARWASPDNYDAFVPHHVLVTGRLFRPLVNLLLPRRRPMDDMFLGGRAPQEDDFAMISLGAPTPYTGIAFCRQRGAPSPLLALDRVDEPVRERSRAALDTFYRVLTREYRKRLILKSPPHTGRIALLAQWFPGARFIHLSRNPESLVRSTCRLWGALDWTQGLQRPRYSQQELLDHVHQSGQLMYDAYFRQRDQLAPGQVVELKFEDLIHNPVETVRLVYDQLDLAWSDGHAAAIRQYFEERQGHRPSGGSLDPHQREQLERFWSRYMTEFGYAGRTAETVSH